LQALFAARRRWVRRVERLLHDREASMIEWLAWRRLAQDETLADAAIGERFGAIVAVGIVSTSISRCDNLPHQRSAAYPTIGGDD
jgi:hypothetical protein